MIFRPKEQTRKDQTSVQCDVKPEGQEVEKKAIGTLEQKGGMCVCRKGRDIGMIVSAKEQKNEGQMQGSPRQ